jgi:hypothetical protein
MITNFKTQLLLVSMLLYGFQCFSQTDIEVYIQEAAQAYFNAKMCDDYETILGYTYPDVIEKAGGPENVKTALIQIQETQRRKGFALQQYKLNPPLQQSKVGEETHAIVPITTIARVPGGRVITDTHIIAVGTEENKRWYIIETTSLDDRNINKVLANWDETMLIPYKKAPIYKEDK